MAWRRGLVALQVFERMLDGFLGSVYVEVLLVGCFLFDFFGIFGELELDLEVELEVDLVFEFELELEGVVLGCRM